MRFCSIKFWTEKKIYRLLIYAVASIVMPMASEARASVIYLYTGNDYNSFTGTSPLSTSDFISVTLTFAAALPANLNDMDETANLLDWTITDQNAMLSQGSGANLLEMSLTTNSSGAITEWSILAQSNPCGGSGVLCVTERSNFLQGNGEVDSSVYEQFNGSGGLASTGQGLILLDPGVWTQSSVPEPATAEINLPRRRNTDGCLSAKTCGLKLVWGRQWQENSVLAEHHRNRAVDNYPQISELRARPVPNRYRFDALFAVS